MEIVFIDSNTFETVNSFHHRFSWTYTDTTLDLLGFELVPENDWPTSFKVDDIIDIRDMYSNNKNTGQIVDISTYSCPTRAEIMVSWL